MKHLVALIIALLITQLIALADTLGSYLPVSSIWGTSRVAYVSDSGFNLTKVQIGQAAGLKRSNITIESYPVDAYYVFSAEMYSHRGLSKIAYIVNNFNKPLSQDLITCKNTFIEAMKCELGAPDAETNAVTKWIRDGYTVEIGAGKFKNYTGSSQMTVGIIISGTSISNTVGQNIDSENAIVPDNQVAMRKYMFDPLNQSDRIDLFVSGLYTINGLSYQSGSKGNAVLEIQNMLANLGFMNSGDVDKSYGKKTTNAVSSFQSQYGITKTGTADLATQFMLVMCNSAFERKNSCYIAQYGKYAVVIWPMKAFYIGTLSNLGMFDTGTYYYVNGEYYNGTYQNNLRSGQGTAYFPNGDIYIGQWQKDRMNGTGTYYFHGKNASMQNLVGFRVSVVGLTTGIY